jgi:hypothetical protein
MDGVLTYYVVCHVSEAELSAPLLRVVLQDAGDEVVRVEGDDGADA